MKANSSMINIPRDTNFRDPDMVVVGDSRALPHRSLPAMLPPPTIWLVEHPASLDEFASRSLRRRREAVTQTTVSSIRTPWHCLTPRRSSASGVFTTARTLVVSSYHLTSPSPPSAFSVIHTQRPSLRRLPNWPSPAQSPPKRAARSFRRRDPLRDHRSGKALLCTSHPLSVLSPRLIIRKS
jgi:hypothetical protein